MLILEGADMLGKTTLARAISIATDCKIDKFGLPESEYVGWKPWAERIQPDSICDRYALSEFIYGITCRGFSKLSPENWMLLRKSLETSGGAVWILLVCEPKSYEAVLAKRFNPAVEAFTADQCRAVNMAYWDLYNVGQWHGYDMPDRCVAYEVKLDPKTGDLIQPWFTARRHGALDLTGCVIDWQRDSIRRRLVQADPSKPWLQ